jgi:hypothetical protein
MFQSDSTALRGQALARHGLRLLLVRIKAWTAESAEKGSLRTLRFLGFISESNLRTRSRLKLSARFAQANRPRKLGVLSG